MRRAVQSTIQRRVLAWYRSHGRHDLPWRSVRVRPYGIVVAEIMLQQTNVPKVAPKYRTFLRRFPSWRALAMAQQREVVRAWRGLGYNRRALNLHRCAQKIVREYRGRVPRDVEVLEALPGIGPYTARAICAFAYNADVAAVDVNIARLLRRWGYVAADATPGTVQRAAQEMVPRGGSRTWHSALMDFASAVCTRRAPQCATCVLRAACPSYPCAGDAVARRVREVGRVEAGRHVPRRIYRGRIVEALRDAALATDTLGARIKADYDAVRDRAWLERILAALRAEGIIDRRHGRWQLA